MVTYGVYIFVVACFSLLYFRENVISILLSLELMMVGLFLILVPLMVIKMIILVTFLTVVVCEASLGLSLLVLMVYYSGNDYLRSSDFLI